MKPKSKPRRKLAAFRLPRPILARLRGMARRAGTSQSRIVEALIHSATI